MRACVQFISSLLSKAVKHAGEERVFIGDASFQVNVSTRTERSIVVTNLDEALAALAGVADQGGGCPADGTPGYNISAGPLGGGLAHFARFREVLDGRAYGPNDTVASGPTGDPHPTNWSAVYSFEPNPSVSSFPVGTHAHDLSLGFAAHYTYLLVSLHGVFNGRPDTFIPTLHQMYVLRNMATGLMRVHDPRFPKKTKIGIGPSWEYVPARSQYVSRGGRPR